MQKIFSIVFHPITMGLIGLIGMSVIVWFILPVISIGESEPFDPIWVRITLLALLWGGWILRQVFKAWKRKKTNAALVDGMAKGPSAADKEVQALDKRFTQAIETLKQAPGAKKGVFGGGGYLYELPWYIFIGAPGSGKTTALLNAGLTFPLAEKMGAGAVRGVGGTRNCDWWFTDEAVLVDTAGRYTTQESDKGADSAAWDGFLGLLKKARPRRPINGVMLTVNVQDLLQQNPNERKEHAAKLRARMQELTEKLGVRAPVYVLVTKVDLIAGFNEMFGDLGKEERNQVWGFTFPHTPDSNDDPLQSFGAEFAALEKRVRDRVMPRMDAEPDVLKRAAIFNFPQQFSGIKGLLGGFLEQVFSGGGSLEERPMLRGVYFTSGTQEGTPIDRVLGTLSRTFGVERKLAAMPGARGKSFFLHRLLKDVVFSEQGLVGQNRAMERRRTTMRLAGFGATALIAVAVIGGWAWSFARNKAYIQTVDAKLPEVKKLVDSIPPANSGDITPLPAPLMAVRTAPLPEGFQIDQPPRTMTLGLYQGQKLDAAANLGYQRLLETALLPRILKRSEERLRASNKNNLEAAYANLKGYLMLYSPENFDAEDFKAWVLVDWEQTTERTLTPEQREQMALHLDALVSRGAPAPKSAMDQQLVTAVREMLAVFPLDYRIFSRLKRLNVGADVPAFTVANEAGPGALSVLERASGEPLTKGIPGLFTKQGYERAFQKAVDRAARQLALEQEWVLGIKAADAKPLDAVQANPELVNRVRRLYLEEYIKTWDAYIADVRVVPMDNAEKALQVSRSLGSVDSPLVKFLRGVARETTLVPPPDAAGQAGSQATAIGAASNKLTEKLNLLKAAKQEAAALAGKVDNIGGTGAPAVKLEQMVDDHFLPIRRLFIGKPEPIMETMKLYEQIYNYLAAVDAAKKSGSPPPPAAMADAVRAAAGQQPGPVKEALEKLAGAGAAGAVDAAKKATNDELKPIQDMCARTIPNRYPFTPSAAADVQMNDFGDLFGGGGLFDEFFKAKLAPLVDKTTNPWSFRPTTDGKRPTVNTEALRQFQNAERIREVFFRNGGKTPSFKVDIRVLEMDPALKEIGIDLGGGTGLRFQNGNTAPQSAQFPTAPQIKLLTNPPGTPLVFDGPWALFRMFDRFEIQPGAQPERFTVALNLDGKRARMEVNANSVFNPFRLREMQSFRCPGNL
jgi:type VI secretion system protein ImpL